MKCAWDQFLILLPHWLKNEVSKKYAFTLQELRLRQQKPPELITSDGNVFLNRCIDEEDIRYCINAASRYSPWATQTAKYGYITAPGGHRIGLCGHATMVNNEISGIHSPTSLCIRIARDFADIGKLLDNTEGSILIIGKPGWGKTTLLRDIVRRRSTQCNGAVSVIDEKSEIFPEVNGVSYFETGARTDIMRGCCKPEGIQCVLRNMGSACIVVDEITAQADCAALCDAARCGVDVIATAHAADRYDLYNRRAYKPIIESRIFDTLVIMQPDKSYYTERMIK